MSPSLKLALDLLVGAAAGAPIVWVLATRPRRVQALATAASTCTSLSLRAQVMQLSGNLIEQNATLLGLVVANAKLEESVRQLEQRNAELSVVHKAEEP